MSSNGETSGDPLAQMAVQEVCARMIVGLGTGRAAARAIAALARRVIRQKLQLKCVATSMRSAQLAESLGLRIVALSEVGRVDILFDGVDELDPNMSMTKGGGGAMTHEKIVAEAADLCIYLMDQSKKVAHLGERCPLPVEVLDSARAACSIRLATLGLVPRLRLGEDGIALPTDHGNVILNCGYGETSRGDLDALAIAIDAIPGVVGHGLFVDQADIVLIESELGATDGKIERIVRS